MRDGTPPEIVCIARSKGKFRFENYVRALPTLAAGIYIVVLPSTSSSHKRDHRTGRRRSPIVAGLSLALFEQLRASTAEADNEQAGQSANDSPHVAAEHDVLPGVAEPMHAPVAGYRQRSGGSSK